MVSTKCGKIKTGAIQCYIQLFCSVCWMHCLFLPQVIASEVRDHESQAEAVRIEGETRHETRSESDKLTHQWEQIQSRFVQYQKSTESDQTDAATVVIVSTADVSTIMFSDCALYEENLRKLIALVGEVARGLESQILCGREYEEFSQQEDKLKVGDTYVLRSLTISLSFFLYISPPSLSLFLLYLSISLYLSICFSVSLSQSLSFYICILLSLSLSPSILLCLYIYISLNITLSLSLSLSLCLYISLSFCHFRLMYSE